MSHGNGWDRRPMSTTQLYWKTRALQGIMFTYMACLHRGEYFGFAFYFCPSFIPDSATFHSYAWHKCIHLSQWYPKSDLAKLDIQVPCTTFGLMEQRRRGVPAYNKHRSIPYPTTTAVCECAVSEGGWWECSPILVLTLDGFLCYLNK